MSATTGSRWPRGDALAPLAWALVAVLVRLAWLAHQPAVIAWDGIIYDRTARRIALGMGFVDSWTGLPPLHPTAFYPVGYPAALGAAYALAGPHLRVAGLLNVLAAAVSVWGAVHLARRAWGSASGHLAGALLALSPGAVLYASTLMTEPLSAALLTAALCAASWHGRRASWPSAVAAGVLLGAGGLVRPQALLLAPVVAWLAAPSPGLAPRVRALALVGASCCAVVLPWTARNCAALDGCALVSVNGGSNLWIGADPEARGMYRDLRPREGCGHVRGEVAKDRCYGALALARIRRDPVGWLALAPAKVNALLDQENVPVFYLRDATGGRAFRGAVDLASRVLTAWHRLVLALAALASLPLARRPSRTREEWLCASVVAGSVLVHAVFFGGDRYHFVFGPALAVLASGVVRSPRGTLLA